MESSASGPGRSYASASGSGTTPRRPSYASVASGASQSRQVPHTRGGPPVQTSLTTPHNSYPPRSFADRRHTHSIGSARTAGIYGSARENTNAMASLPEYSRRYAGIERDDPNVLVIPTYLKDSRYAAKLQAAHATNSRAVKARSFSVGSPNTTPLGTGAYRPAHSYRGVKEAVVESHPPEHESTIYPLPTRWSDDDKHPGLEVANEGLGVKYSGSKSSAETEAASVRADHSIPRECGLYYFEVEIKQKSKDCAVAIGFSSRKASLERLPGWEAESWAYHGDDGKAFSEKQHGEPYGQPFAAGDTIGCGINFVTGQAFFTKNGVDLGTAFKELKNSLLYPSVGIKKSSGAVVTVNFGQTPFLYDIDDRAETEREKVRSEVRATDTSSLHPRTDEHSLTQQLVAQFLSHSGYVETAKAFSKERMPENSAAHSISSKATEMTILDTTDAIHRQRETTPPRGYSVLIITEIRNAILRGKIDQALDITNVHFPTVLESSPEIVFRLRCRKFIELMGKASDLHGRQQSLSERKQKGSNGFASSTEADDIFAQHMELDEDQHQLAIDSSKTTTFDADNDLAYHQLLTEALSYGQVLEREYGDKEDSEYRTTLRTIFSLVAYHEPRQSVNGHLLDNEGRIKIAEELNSAILGRSPTAAVEKMFRQAETLLDILGRRGGPATFVNMKQEFAHYRNADRHGDER